MTTLQQYRLDQQRAAILKMEDQKRQEAIVRLARKFSSNKKESSK